MVVLLGTVLHRKTCPEHRGQLLGLITSDIQPRALGRTIRSETAQHHGSACANRGSGQLDVGALLVAVGQEVEHCPVMPQRHLRRWGPAKDVCGDEMKVGIWWRVVGQLGQGGG